MDRRKYRQTVYVCISLLNNTELISKIVEADSADDAATIFEDNFKLKAKEVLGPFFKKKVYMPEIAATIKFDNASCRKAEYHDWLVNAFMLENPQNHAYLVFVSHLENKKTPFPKNTVVPISQLRFINE